MIYLYYPLLDSISQLQNQNYNFSQIASNFSQFQIINGVSGIMYRKNDNNDFSIFSNSLSRIISGFHFDGTILRLLLKNSTLGEDPSCQLELRTLIQKALEKTKAGKGFSSFQSTSASKLLFTDLQDSELFCQWLLMAALEQIGRKDLVVQAIFNERGHILLV